MRYVQCRGFWGVGQSFKRGTLASPALLGSSVSHSRMGQLAFLPPSVSNPALLLILRFH